MLIVFGGLPGTGKSTIAKKLAAKIKATYIRIDTIEQSLINFGIKREEVGPVGYLASYSIALENLQCGLTVVADSVNPLESTRNAWKEVAQAAGVKFFAIEVHLLGF